MRTRKAISILNETETSRKYHNTKARTPHGFYRSQLIFKVVRNWEMWEILFEHDSKKIIPNSIYNLFWIDVKTFKISLRKKSDAVIKLNVKDSVELTLRMVCH